MTNNNKQAGGKNSKVEMLADETEYLWSDPANHQHLLEAIESAKNPDNLVVISAEEWHEKYRV